MARISSNPPPALRVPATAADSVQKSQTGKGVSTSSGSSPSRDAYLRGGTPAILSSIDGDHGPSAANLRSPLARGLSGASQAKAVNFNKMSQEQQYDYLKQTTIDRAGGDPSAWKDGDREVNLTGIRSFNGEAHGAKANKYDDMIYVARMVDGKKTVEGFPATVDPGKQKNSPTYRLGDGFFKDAWTRGNVSGDEPGLRQTRDLELQAGGSADMLPTEKQLQFHRGGSGDVNSESRGCQAIRGDRYDRFQQILAEAPASQRDFSYNLIDSHGLPGLRSDGHAERTHSLRHQTSERRNAGHSGDGIGIVRTPDSRLRR
ncbi:MAG: hypothetical protein ABIJ09_21695 [Pseudomonadota bacterium]